MASKIEDYGLIGNTFTAALVSRSGSIDWLCAPRFDSDACFSAIIGYDQHGRLPSVSPLIKAVLVVRPVRGVFCFILLPFRL